MSSSTVAPAGADDEADVAAARPYRPADGGPALHCTAGHGQLVLRDQRDLCRGFEYFKNRQLSSILQ
jgi:hypothetical protein